MKAVLVGIAFAIAIVACASLLFSGYNTALAPDRFKGFWED